MDVFAGDRQMREKVRVKGSLSIPPAGRILVDLPHGLGDQIMCFPLFVSLKKKFPSAEISVFTLNGGSASLLKKNPYISDVTTVPFTFSLIGLVRFFLTRYLGIRRFFRKRRFDCVIVVHRNLFRTILYKLLPVTSLVYNQENVHKTQECRNILDTLGIPLVCDYTLSLPGDDSFLAQSGLSPKGYILLDLYAQHIERDPRQWHGFDALIDILVREGFIVVTAGINWDHTKDPRVVDLVNDTSFDQLLALVKGAKLVVAHDSGIFHFSYSLKTPVIGLYGPVNPADRLPWDSGQKICALYNRQYCSPCIKNKVDIPCINPDRYACMRSITSDEVMAQIRVLLSD